MLQKQGAAPCTHHPASSSDISHSSDQSQHIGTDQPPVKI